jgi:hypothetical protein
VLSAGVAITNPKAGRNKNNVHARRCGNGPADRTRRHVTNAAICAAASMRDDVGDECAVEEGLVAEVGISRLSRPDVAHGRTKISVAGADLNDGGVGAVDGDGRRVCGVEEAAGCVTDSGMEEVAAGHRCAAEGDWFGCRYTVCGFVGVF